MNTYKEKILDSSSGNYTVYNQFDRNYLYYKDTKVAECINGDYNKRFGGISGWISHVEKRIRNRIENINYQIQNLKDERHSLTSQLLGE